MNILNRSVLNRFRSPGYCEHCGRWCDVREAAHVFTKGVGGGSQIDHPFNVVGLGTAFACGCHTRQHQTNRNPSRDDLLEIVAKRTGLGNTDYIRHLILTWQQLDKDTPEAKRLLELYGEKVTR